MTERSSDHDNAALHLVVLQVTERSSHHGNAAFHMVVV